MNITKVKRPECLEGYTIQQKTACGSLYLTMNELNDKLFEIRMTLGKSGSCYSIMFQTIALLLSVMLQEGISREKIRKTLENQFEGNCGNAFWQDGVYYYSCIDFIVHKILEDLASRGEIKLEAE